jgi:hypothetical protein
VACGATFFTVANARYFPGVVALLNSLRLTGHADPVCVLDRGLTQRQRERLAEHAAIVDLPPRYDLGPYLSKPFPHFVEAEGVAIVVDADLVVTAPLGDVIERAQAGKICVYPEHRDGTNRWFAAWVDGFALRAPLRREPYVNAGFVALSVDRWAGFFARWWEACAAVPTGAHFVDPANPFWAGDMDALNALLMSELPADAVEVLPAEEHVHFDELPDVQVVDRHTLGCTLRDRRVRTLHYSLGPKAWEPTAWFRLRRDAYVDLLPRLFFGHDVALRLEPHEVPFWLRPSRMARVAVEAADRINGGRYAPVWALPGRPTASDLLRYRAECAFWGAPEPVQRVGLAVHAAVKSRRGKRRGAQNGSGPG